MDYNQINTPKPKGLWRLIFIIALFFIATPFVVPKLQNKISKVKQLGIEKLADEEGFYKVTKIINGDTFELFSGIRVKYIGIDAPEIETDLNSYECYADEAIVKNTELLIDKRVKLVVGVESEDEYGQFLRYVYLPDGTFVNLELIKGGFASALNIEPNSEFKNEFKEAEREAITEGRGMWGVCVD